MNPRTPVSFALAGARAFVVGVASWMLIACTPPSDTSASPLTTESQTVPEAQGEQLRVTDLVVGRGRTVAVGDVVRAHYTMSLASGKVLSTSWTSGTPLRITVGGGGVIRGWDQGLVGMHEGGSRTMLIPAHLAFGSGRRPPIVPANAAIRVDVQIAADPR